MSKTLEDILRTYKFAPPKRRIFRKERIFVDDLPEYMTKTGNYAYRKLICLLYDIANILGNDINKNAIHRIVDELDFITTQNYW
jgi:hypothetical protein